MAGPLTDEQNLIMLAFGLHDLSSLGSEGWMRDLTSFTAYVNQQIEQFTSSCIYNAQSLEGWIGHRNVTVVTFTGNRPDLAAVQGALQEQQCVMLHYHLPEGGDHVFTIMPLEGGEAQIQHAWQDMHNFRKEPAMKTADMLQHISDLADPQKQANARVQLFGEDHAQVKPSNSAWKCKGVTKLPAKDIFAAFGEHGCQTDAAPTWSNGDLAKYRNGVAPKLPDAPPPSEKPSVRSSVQPSRRCSVNFEGQPGDLPVYTESDVLRLPPAETETSKPDASRLGKSQSAMLGGALGFIFSAAGVAWTLADPPPGYRKWQHSAEQMALGTGAGAASGATAAAVSNALGQSLWRAGAAGAVVATSFTLIYDGVKRSRGEITGVEQRKSAASHLGGALGGLGAGTGVVALCFTPPLGWSALAAGFACGVGGGLAGGYGSAKIDGLIWDESEDHVMLVYEFFDIPAKRGQMPRPVMNPQELQEKFSNKFKQNSDDKWKQQCKVHLHFLLRSMYPKFGVVVDAAARLKDELEERSIHANVASRVASEMMEKLLHSARC
eukprot:TRINITY_DN51695_c0_g1_i1.p1 TRINITY_DN51695_c0_g1~~TRINITY_DN51695_c0_g1_i1.p1  ORF type:complete len:550 (-),score=95.96 TRINITY_DN51695_c0_g1_i1:153-1802(-)